MSTSILSLRWVSSPRRGSKIATSTATQIDVEPNETVVQPPSQLTHDEPKLSPFITLPMEIQDQIYDHILTPWTMTLLSNPKQYEDLTNDETITPKPVGTYTISGPPGTSLLLVCKAIYHTFRPRYGQACTGLLILGRVRGWARRRLPLYLSKTFKLRQFYNQITRLSVNLDLDNARIALNFRTLLPNLKHVDCIIDEGHYGPLLRLMDTTTNFLRGHHDNEIIDWTKPAVNYFLCVDSRSMPPVHRNSSPWDDEHAVVNVRVVGSMVSPSGVLLGLHYRWEGPRVIIVSRVARFPTGGVYDEPRTMPVSEERARNYSWVKSLK